MQYLSRDHFIVDRARGKKILHLGCVGFADLDTDDRISRASESLHYTLTQVAEVTGVDYSHEAINYFRRQGVFDNVVFGNVEQLERLDTNETFDLIVAGDIIEHLSSPGLMLDGLKRFAMPSTEILITTPHSFGILGFLRYVFGTFSEGAEHVMTFNMENIRNLLERHGFETIAIHTCYQKNAAQARLFRMGRAFFERFPKYGGTLLVLARIRKDL